MPFRSKTRLLQGEAPKRSARRGQPQMGDLSSHNQIRKDCTAIVVYLNISFGLLASCANWFAARLEAERGASRAGGKEQVTSLGPGSLAVRRGSALPAGQDYTFGGPRSMDVEASAGSPRSEYPPHSIGDRKSVV